MPARTDRRCKTFVLFGQMKTYKGIDVLVEAVAALPEAQRDRSRFIVAGAAMMDMTPIEARIKAAGLGSHIELRYGRLSEEEMVDLFHEADVFVLPYRAVDASGVFYLLRPQAKWIIASRVGVFAEDFVEGVDGETVQPGDVEDLARAIGRAVDAEAPKGAQTRGASWSEIGVKTRGIYIEALAARAGGPASVGSALRSVNDITVSPDRAVSAAATPQLNQEGVWGSDDPALAPAWKPLRP